MQEAVKAIALCHNVTPVSDNNSDRGVARSESVTSDEMEMDIFSGPDRESSGTSRTKRAITYQASSPDEVTERY